MSPEEDYQRGAAYKTEGGSRRDRDRGRDRTRDRDYGGDNTSYRDRRRERGKPGVKDEEEYVRRGATNNFSDEPENDEGKRTNFDFKLFIKQKYIDSSMFTYSNIDKIVSESKCTDIFFDEKTQIPDLPGKIVNIEGTLLDYKADALYSILRKFAQAEQEESQSRNESKLSVVIFVPEGLVSMVIGTKGRQINTFKEDSRASIIVNQPIIGMALRSVDITGTVRQITHAIKSIYNWLEKQAYTVEDYDKQTAKPMSKSQIKVTAKFVVSEESQGYLIGK
jgi:hypothetical protein